jgi:hypothetical protein
LSKQEVYICDYNSNSIKVLAMRGSIFWRKQSD